MAYTKAGIRFSRESYVLVDAAGGGGIERKRIYNNPDTTQQMTTDTLFSESEILDYDFLAFKVTNTEGSIEVEEWCEIEPLHHAGGQFVISNPVVGGGLYVRKIYRSSGNVKPSASVFDIGTTTQDKNQCIIKSVDAVKIK